MINALGLLEVRGLTASIAAADAMLKAAQVRILNSTVTPSGMVTLVVEGDLAACRAALDAGVAVAATLGQVIMRKEIGRPDKDTEWFVMHLTNTLSSSTADTPSNRVAKPQVTEIPAIQEADLDIDHSAADIDAHDNVMQSVHTEKALLSEELIIADDDKTVTKPVVSDEIQVSDTPNSEMGIEEKDLLNFISKQPQGCNITEIINHFNSTRQVVKAKLVNCISKGLLRKQGNKYYVIA